MAERDISVKFTGDASDLTRASEKAERSLADTGKSIGGSLSGLAGPAAVAGAAIAGLGVVAWDLASAAMEDEAAAAQLAHQMKTAAGASDEAIASAENYIDVLSRQVAVADDELRPALSTLVTATGDVGKAQDLLALSTDIAAGTGKDLETVTNAVAKAQLGSTAGLSKLGLATEDATGKTMSLDQILGSARDKFAGAGEAAAQTSSGGLKNAQIRFDELKESLGAKLLPVLGKLAEVFTEKVIPAGEAVVEWAEKEWPKIMEQIGPDLKELADITEQTFNELKRWWDEWGDEVLWVAVNVVGVALRGLLASFRTFLDGVVNVITLVRWVWGGFGETVAAVSDFVHAAVNRMAGWIDGAMAAVRWVVAISSNVVHAFSDSWDRVKSAVGSGVDFVHGVMGDFGARISGALHGIAEMIIRPFDRAFNAISDLWNNTIGSLNFTFPDWVPVMGGNTIDVPDVPHFSAFGAMTIVMPPGTDGYDVARQISTFSRTVAPVENLTVAVR